MLRVSSAVAAVMLLVVASSASAQVVFMPVKYQHNAGMTYYYGGSDPTMHAYADRVACRNGYPSVTVGDHYSSLHCTLGQVGENRVILSDCLPYRNAAVYGYREHDAANEASASVPRYFRMRDQLEGAVPAADGSLIVPASGVSRHHHATDLASRPATAPAGELKPRAIIILPKKAPQRDSDTKAVKFVASAK